MVQACSIKRIERALQKNRKILKDYYKSACNALVIAIIAMLVRFEDITSRIIKLMVRAF